jgi:hypothetical protein
VFRSWTVGPSSLARCRPLVRGAHIRSWEGATAAKGPELPSCWGARLDVFEGRLVGCPGAGRSAAWLARLPWEQEVGGSSPPAPIACLGGHAEPAWPVFLMKAFHSDA